MLRATDWCHHVGRRRIASANRSTHHSWKLQEEWNKYGEQAFATEVIHAFDQVDEHLELLLEIFERSEVFIRDAVITGYNVSDEIIRDTSLVLKYCDDAIDIYFRVNEKNFSAANAAHIDAGFLAKLKNLVFPGQSQKVPDQHLDIERHAAEYLQSSLTKLFIECSVDEKTSKILAHSYVVDVKKMRGNSFRYWGRDRKKH